jgi:hypothetical protein
MEENFDIVFTMATLMHIDDESKIVYDWMKKHTKYVISIEYSTDETNNGPVTNEKEVKIIRSVKNEKELGDRNFEILFKDKVETVEGLKDYKRIIFKNRDL